MVPQRIISQVATITMGTSPKGDTYNQDGSGLPLLNGPTEFGPTYPNCTLFTTDSKRECRPGDLIFCVRGSTTGRMNWANRVYSLGRGVCSIRGETTTDTRFIKYCLNWKLEALLKYAGGGTFPNLTQDTIRDFEIPFPEHRRKIAAILSAYDDLIENNLRRITILEKMAQNLYREWFIKFCFPGHQHARFIDSPLGRIPVGWEMTEFRNIFEIKYGKTLPKTKIAEVGPYPVYGAGDVIGYYEKVLCQEKCALVTSRGNGSGTVWRTREAAFVTNNSLIMLPKVEFKHWDYSFVELLLKHSNVMKAKTGSAQPQVTIENLNYVKAIVPKKTYVEKFCSFVTPLYEQVDLYYLKNTTLRRTRDLLLPRLISGEVDVSELDIAVPEEDAA